MADHPLGSGEGLLADGIAKVEGHLQGGPNLPNVTISMGIKPPMRTLLSSEGDPYYPLTFHET